ncbi:uncharacterized protein LOC126653455 [Mercurialis annua]|uniref:uncharacterized protein LOC126653455 n=1 Tax=Mercurialis annua TaxID=3986 RepID=UPI00215E0ACA|nr:uncharacterized protein LOC126653455 [Mercurialis annua]
MILDMNMFFTDCCLTINTANSFRYSEQTNNILHHYTSTFSTGNYYSNTLKKEDFDDLADSTAPAAAPTTSGVVGMEADDITELAPAPASGVVGMEPDDIVDSASESAPAPANEAVGMEPDNIVGMEPDDIVDSASESAPAPANGVVGMEPDDIVDSPSESAPAPPSGVVGMEPDDIVESASESAPAPTSGVLGIEDDIVDSSAAAAPTSEVVGVGFELQDWPREFKKKRSYSGAVYFEIYQKIEEALILQMDNLRLMRNVNSDMDACRNTILTIEKLSGVREILKGCGDGKTTKAELKLKLSSLDIGDMDKFLQEVLDDIRSRQETLALPERESVDNCSDTESDRGISVANRKRKYCYGDEINKPVVMQTTKKNKVVKLTEVTGLVEPKRNVYQCKECKQEFDNFRALGGHMASHNRKMKSDDDLMKSTYECLICHHVFNDFRALGGHIASHNRKERAEKAALGGDSSSLSIVAGSSVDNLIEKSYECNICYKKFSTGQALGGHKTYHRKIADSLNQAQANPEDQLRLDQVPANPEGQVRLNKVQANPETQAKSSCTKITLFGVDLNASPSVER